MTQHKRILIGYYLTLALLVVGAFLPQGRWWGLNGWSYFPSWIWGPCAAFLVLLPLIIVKFPTGLGQTISTGRFWLLGLAGTILCAAAFVAFANRTHFLGDGIQILHNLRTGTATHMIWNVPAEWIQAKTLGLIGGSSESDAELALRIISWGSGILTICVLLWAARRLDLVIGDTWLFVLGVVSSGIGLFFFGYAETYPPFIAAVVLTCVLGILAAKEKVSARWPLVACVVAMALHLFAVTFLPAVVYLFVRRTRLWKSVTALSLTIRIAIALVAFGALYGAIQFVAAHDYQIRFMLVPPVTDRFTVDGYTLFSVAHLGDLLNLFVLLIPSGILFASWMFRRDNRKMISAESGFLVAAFICSLFLLIIFDPKLGMFRDWDLFAYATVPLILYWLTVAFSQSVDSAARRLTLFLAIVLNIAVLAPRIAVTMSQDRSIEMVDRIFTMDKTKSRSLHYLMVEYLRGKGLTNQADSLQAETFRRYPEIKLQEKAVKIYESGMLNESVVLARQVIGVNPSYVDPYSLLCAIYSSTNQLPQAQEYGEISFGLNSRNAAIAYNMANVNARMGKVDEARKYLESALIFEPDHQPSLYGMASIAVANRDMDDLRRWLVKLPVKDSVDASKFSDLVYSACARSMFDEAADLLKFGIAHKFDTAAAAEIIRRFPDLRARLK